MKVKHKAAVFTQQQGCNLNPEPEPRSGTKGDFTKRNQPDTAVDDPPHNLGPEVRGKSTRGSSTVGHGLHEHTQQRKDALAEETIRNAQQCGIGELFGLPFPPRLASRKNCGRTIERVQIHPRGRTAGSGGTRGPSGGEVGVLGHEIPEEFRRILLPTEASRETAVHVRARRDVATESVVMGTALGVAQRRVGIADLLESLLGTLRLALVRVELQRQPAVGLFESFLVCASTVIGFLIIVRNAESLVVVFRASDAFNEIGNAAAAAATAAWWWGF